MSTELIKNDEAEFYEAEEVEGTAIDGDSNLQEEESSPIVIDITYFVDPNGGQSQGGQEEGEGKEQEEKGDQEKEEPGEDSQSSDQKSEDNPVDIDPKGEGDAMKTGGSSEINKGSDIFVQVRTKDRTLVGR